MTKKEPSWDLEERTALFGESVIDLCKTVPRSILSDPIVKQLIRAATSVGANYCEADDAESRRDFRHKIGISKKESRECKHFLRMLVRVHPHLADNTRPLWKEAQELNLILNSIFRKVR